MKLITFEIDQEVKGQSQSQLEVPMAANLATCSTLEAFKCHLASELFLLDFLQPISIGVSKELTMNFRGEYFSSCPPNQRTLKLENYKSHEFLSDFLSKL